MLKTLVLKVFYKLYLWIAGAFNLLKDNTWDRPVNLPNLPSQSDKTIVITGGSRGIGLEAVRTFLRLDCKVIIGCRNTQSAAELLKDVTPDHGVLKILPLDLMSMASVRRFAEEVQGLGLNVNILINNAGIMFGARKDTEDGFESQLSTNYLGHFLLTHLLLPLLEKSGNNEFPARVVNVSSIAHFVGSWMDFDDLNLKKRYVTEQAYGNSKAAQIMFSKYLDSTLQSRDSRVRVNCLHPGVVYTDLYDNAGWMRVFKLIMKTPVQSSVTLVHAALGPELGTIKTHGVYLDNTKPARNSSFTSSLENQARLWQVTCNMLNINDFGVHVQS